MAEDWRRVIATLADAARRNRYARVVLGTVAEASMSTTPAKPADRSAVLAWARDRVLADDGRRYRRRALA